MSWAKTAGHLRRRNAAFQVVTAAAVKSNDLHLLGGTSVSQLVSIWTTRLISAEIWLSQHGMTSLLNMRINSKSEPFFWFKKPLLVPHQHPLMHFCCAQSCRDT
jgi:hypothetical protein